MPLNNWEDLKLNNIRTRRKEGKLGKVTNAFWFINLWSIFIWILWFNSKKTSKNAHFSMPSLNVAIKLSEGEVLTEQTKVEIETRIIANDQIGGREFQLFLILPNVCWVAPFSRSMKNWGKNLRSCRNSLARWLNYSKSGWRLRHLSVVDSGMGR